MTRTYEKPPLYRKENTTAHRANFHRREFSDDRHTKNREDWLALERTREHIGSRGSRNGRDYTPLFKFLLSKVGQPWAAVHSEAVSRLDKPDPIFWMVQLNEDDQSTKLRVGESSYFSSLYVDDEGILRVVNPDVNEATQEPFCTCCTHTFNGKPFLKKAKPQK